MRFTFCIRRKALSATVQVPSPSSKSNRKSKEEFGLWTKKSHGPPTTKEMSQVHKPKSIVQIPGLGLSLSTRVWLDIIYTPMVMPIVTLTHFLIFSCNGAAQQVHCLKTEFFSVWSLLGRYTLYTMLYAVMFRDHGHMMSYNFGPFRPDTWPVMHALYYLRLHAWKLRGHIY